MEENYVYGILQEESPMPLLEEEYAHLCHICDPFIVQLHNLIDFYVHARNLVLSIHNRR